MTGEDRNRRLNARRFNERTKLFATLQNNTAIAIAAGAFVLPWANATTPNAQPHWIWLIATAVLHITAQLSLGVMKSED